MQANCWTVNDIKWWNIATFKENSEWKQYRRVKDEVKEYRNARNAQEKLEELADIYIAFAGLSRFSEVGNVMCFIMQQIDGFEDLQKAVNAKMLINTRRQWNKKMQHIEG